MTHISFGPFCFSEAEMVDFAGRFALFLKVGDLIALDGDLGMGKSTFARAVIRHAAGCDTLEVPSPTFTLVQTYSLPAGPELWHADLYRITSGETVELGLEEGLERAALLVEWPDRLPPDMLSGALTVHFGEGKSENRPEADARALTFWAPADFEARLKPLLGDLLRVSSKK